MTALFIAPRVPVVEPNSGLCNPIWYRFFSDLFGAMSGGSGGGSVPDIEQALVMPPASFITDDLIVRIGAVSDDLNEGGLLPPASDTGVFSLSFGTTGLTPSTATKGVVTVAGTLVVSNGGSGATTLTGYLKGNGTSPFTASATIPGSDITGAALTKTDDTNVTLTLGGTPATALLRATSLTLGWTGTLAVSRGGSGAATLTGYLKGNGVAAFTASATIPGSDISGNISGNAANVTGTVAATNGGTGQTVYAVGDILYASTTTALSRLADVATGNALISGGVGVAPSWGKIGLTTHVTGTLPVANGGTGVATLTANTLIKGNGTSPVAASIIQDDGTYTGVGAAPVSTFRMLVQGVGTGATSYPLVTRNSASTNLLHLQDDGVLYTGLAANSPYNNTTASAANAVLTAPGGFLQRSTSSARYKTDIEDYTRGLEAVKALRPVFYKGKTDGDKVFAGLIAEEVDAAGLTEFVLYDEQGRPDALYYQNMIALLAKAVQELSGKVEALEAKL